MKIHVLPDFVANMIAAGEVVDRPASVVKELAENSIDAGARNVAVTIEEAGSALIAVEDDGAGMSSSDAVLSLKRHATSKVATAADLDRILTLGFRGEALPSIASVSRLTLVTRTEEELEAVRIVSEGGREEPPVAAAGARGTRVEVRALFFNTPARRKFLKSAATEIKNVAEVVTKLALIHPEVGFELDSDGRRLLSLPSGQTLAQRAGEAVFSQSALYWHAREEGGLSLTIAFTAPHEGRGRRDGLRFFVNRRAVADRILYAAAMEGYRGLLADGRFPVLFLWLTLDPAEVDVNVHPAKREVRFADEGRIFRFVASTVSAALSEAPWLSGGAGGGAAEGYGHAPEEVSLSRVSEAISIYGARAASRGFTGAENGGSPQGYSNSSRAGGYGPSGGSRSYAPYRGVPLQGLADAADDAGVFAGLRYMGIIDATYLVFEDTASGGLALMDQHAAHERILYERFLKGARERATAQKLLVPVVVECGAARLGLLEERAGMLAALGFSTEPFGGRALCVTSAPAGLDAGMIEAVVEDFLSSELPEEAGSLKSIEERLAARAACSAAVKAGKVLHQSEAMALLERLSRLNNPTHCPHGRPLLVRLGREKVESLFHRR